MGAVNKGLTPEDQEFLRAFEECSLGKTCWTHDAHIRMAWLQLERYGSLAPALEAIRSGIQRYNNSQGVKTGYHETVTVAFAELIHYLRQLWQPPAFPSWRAFLEKNADLLSKESPILLNYYSKDLLFSDRARQQFVAPDKKPLPVAGKIRVATESDARALLSVYEPFVKDTVISFELTVPTVENFRERIREYSQVTPYLVSEIQGEIVGFAYGSKHREREAYRWSADASIYVKESVHGRGIGKALYATLFRNLYERGYYNIFGGITLPNPKSVGLHESFGFQPIGTYSAVGYKSGVWHDVGWWQKVLRPADGPPSPLREIQCHTT